VRRVLAVLVGAGAALALGAGPASAHDVFVSSTPSDGSTVDSAPDQVVLTFAEPAVAIGTIVTITGPDGSALAQGTAQLVGSTVVQALVPNRPAGTYTVLWRVTSDDGHPVTGTFTFTATNPVGASAATQPATAPASPSSAPSASATPGVPAAGVTPTSSPGTRSLGTIIALAVAVLVVVRIGRWYSVRRISAKQAAGSVEGSADDDSAADGAGPVGGA
jgi:methionine-rich copper-binding protein CopC